MRITDTISHKTFREWVLRPGERKTDEWGKIAAMEHIVFLDRDTIRVPMRSPNFSHTWKDYPRTLPEHTVARLADATIGVTNKVRLHKQELSQLPKLRFIAITATGFDNVDIAFARECGIKVANVAHYARQSVPEHVFMMMLALRRNLLTF